MNSEYDPDCLSIDNMLPINSAFVNYKDVEYQPDDTVFKGAAIRGSSIIEYYSSSHDPFPEYDTFVPAKASQSKQVYNVDTKLDLDSISTYDCHCSTLYVPSLPIVVLPTSFKCDKPSNDIVASICEVFSALAVSYEFTPAICEFNAVFVKGATYTKFQVHVYDNSLSAGSGMINEFIVESQRLTGDGFSFNYIFGEIRRILTEKLDTSTASLTEKSRSSSISSTMSSSSPRSSSGNDERLLAALSEEEKIFYLDPLKEMTAADATMESQLEGCRMLCDMIVSNSNFHVQLQEAGMIEVLLRLASSDVFLVSQHAIIALAEFSVSPACMKAIWDVVANNPCYDNFIPFLCSQVTDGPYYTIPKRRHCAHLLTTMLDFLVKQREASQMKREKSDSYMKVVTEMIFSPRNAAKDKARLLHEIPLCFPVPLSRQVSQSTPPASRIISNGTANKAGPLQDEFLDVCINKISGILEHDSKSILDL